MYKRQARDPLALEIFVAEELRQHGDTMEITFSGVQKETDLEREFFRFLVREGLHVRIESNRQGVQ